MTPCQRTAENLLDLLAEVGKRRRFQPADIFDSKKSATNIDGLAVLTARAEYEGWERQKFVLTLAGRSGYEELVVAWQKEEVTPNGIVRQVILNCACEMLEERPALAAILGRRAA